MPTGIDHREAEKHENDPELKEAPFASAERSKRQDRETEEAKEPETSRPEPSREKGTAGDVYGR